MTVIVPNVEQFLCMFPSFCGLGVCQCDLDRVQPRVIGYISNVIGEINLTEELQVEGVYLATAHILELLKKPAKQGGRLSSASEGSVSAGFQTVPVQSIRDWALSRTEYGLELIQILQQVQPPLPEKALNIYPYYGAGVPSKDERV